MGLCVSKQSKQTASMKMLDNHNIYVHQKQKHAGVFSYKSEANIYEQTDSKKLSDQLKTNVSKRMKQKGLVNIMNQSRAADDKQDFQDYLRGRLLFLQQDFIKFLKPSDVIFDIQGLNICRIGKIMETETTNRQQAVKLLLSTILEDSNLLPKFVYALEVRGYRRFIDPINGIYPEKGVMFCQDYIEFIVNYLKGDLIYVLDTLQICSFLYKNGGLEQPDKEHIEAINSTRGRTAACQELFLTVARRNSSWALLLVEAIRETQEYVKVKMDPSSTQKDLERTGVCLLKTKSYDGRYVTLINSTRKTEDLEKSYDGGFVTLINSTRKTDETRKRNRRGNNEPIYFYPQTSERI